MFNFFELFFFIETFEYIKSDFLQDNIQYFLVKLKDHAKLVTLSKELPSKVIDAYLKWKNNKIKANYAACKIDKEYFYNKNRTAGLIVITHSCGMIVGYKEMITSEGLTQIAQLIESTIVINPTIKYACYDTGCKLSAHVQNNQYNYSSSIKDLQFFIDRFHLGNHVKACQKFSCDKNEVVKNINSSICESEFYTFGKYKHVVKHMSQNHYMFFFRMIFESYNNNILSLQ